MRDTLKSIRGRVEGSARFKLLGEAGTAAVAEVFALMEEMAERIETLERLADARAKQDKQNEKTLMGMAMGLGMLGARFGELTGEGPMAFIELYIHAFKAAGLEVPDEFADEFADNLRMLLTIFSEKRPGGGGVKCVRR